MKQFKCQPCKACVNLLNGPNVSLAIYRAIVVSKLCTQWMELTLVMLVVILFVLWCLLYQISIEVSRIRGKVLLR